jgi:hypothetical protein
VADSTVTSSAMSDTTSGSNLFTTQTTSTDATSETPSISGTKWSSIDDELAGMRGMEPGAKYIGDRKSSEGHVVDLSRVVEMTRQHVSVLSPGVSFGTNDRGRRLPKVTTRCVSFFFVPS